MVLLCLCIGSQVFKVCCFLEGSAMLPAADPGAPLSLMSTESLVFFVFFNGFAMVWAGTLRFF